MSRLSQLNKNEAHKALAALAQRQQNAAMQFDGEAGFAAILNAQSNQVETAKDKKSDSKDQQDQREPQDEPLSKRVQPEQLKAQAKKPLAPAAKVAAQPALQHKEKPQTARAEAEAEPMPIKVTASMVVDKTPPCTTEPVAPEDAKLEPVSTVDAIPLIYVAQETPVAVANPVATTTSAEAMAVKTALVADGPTVAPDILVVQTAAASNALPTTIPTTMPMPLAAPTSNEALPPTGGADTASPIALNDVLLPAKFRTLPMPATPVSKLPASPPQIQTQAPATNTTAATTPVELIDDIVKPATNADVAKAATAVLQQLAPVTHALAQPANAQTVKTAAALPLPSPLVKMPDQAATPSVPTPQPVAEATSDRVPQTVPVNPILVVADQQPAVAVNPLLNAAMNVPNPTLQTAAAQAVAASAATGFAATNVATAAPVEVQFNSDGTIDSAAFGNHTLARYDAGALARSGRLPNTAAGAALPANAQVAIQLARAAKNGDRAFNIQLHPAELGRVEVKLDVDSHGSATARILVNSQATLDLLQTHRAGLERALTDAGLKCDAGGISFDLRDGGQNAEQNANQSNQRQAARNNNAATALSGTANATPDTSIITNYTLSLQPGRIDIKA